MDIWIDYFVSEESNIYPFWLKYWAFQGMVRIGSFDKKTGECTRRTDTTAHRFLDFNEEVLSKCMDLVLDVFDKETFDDKELERLVKSGSFEKIYSHVMTDMIKNEKEKSIINEGKWVKYNQGSNSWALVNDIKGYKTGWCIAGHGTAKSFLEDSDIYIYFTKNQHGKYKIPRVTMVVTDGVVDEIRGVEQHQHLEPGFEDIVEEKLREFNNGDVYAVDKYAKEIADAKRTGEIYSKVINNEELTVEDLQFIYEIDYTRSAFGESLDYAWWELDDPRIEKIREKRNLIDDLNTIFTSKKVIKSDINIPYSCSVAGLILPEAIEHGNIHFNYVYDDDKMILPSPLTYNIYYSNEFDDRIEITPENVNNIMKK